MAARALALSSSSSSSENDDDSLDEEVQAVAAKVQDASEEEEEEEEEEDNDDAEARWSALRFRVELEFVQCLAAPFYLHWLAQHEYLEKEQFLTFLKYLTYWARPDYVQYLEHPDCLVFLERLVDDPGFRANLKFVEYRDQIDRDQFNKWRAAHGRTNVFPSLLPGPDDEPTPVIRDYISVDGQPPPPAFYEANPQYDRAKIERNWVPPPGPEEIQDILDKLNDKATDKHSDDDPEKRRNMQLREVAGLMQRLPRSL